MSENVDLDLASTESAKDPSTTNPVAVPVVDLTDEDLPQGEGASTVGLIATILRNVLNSLKNLMPSAPETVNENPPPATEATTAMEIVIANEGDVVVTQDMK